MPVSFRIFLPFNLTHVKYDGFVRADETMRAFLDYARHRDFRPNQLQLVDLSGLSGAQMDLAHMFDLQLRKVERLLPRGGRIRMVLFAPTPAARSMASLIQKSWEPFPAEVTIVDSSEAEALAALGISARSFNALTHDLT